MASSTYLPLERPWLKAYASSAEFRIFFAVSPVPAFLSVQFIKCNVYYLIKTFACSLTPTNSKIYILCEL